MKTIILTFAIISGVTMMSYAQTDGNGSAAKKENAKNFSPEERAKNDTQRATKQLGLTTEQQTNWEAASLTFHTANQPLQDKIQGSTTPDERKEIHQQMKANKDTFKTTVNGFLTPEQITKMNELKEDHPKGKKHK